MDQVRPNRSTGDPYSNPDLVQYLDSMEGLPDVLGPGETEAERERWAPWQHTGNALFARFGEILPGIALALAIAMVGGVVASGFSMMMRFTPASSSTAARSKSWCRICGRFDMPPASKRTPTPPSAEHPQPSSYPPSSSTTPVLQRSRGR